MWFFGKKKEKVDTRFKSTKTMKYAKIIDKGECLSTLDRFPQIPWPETWLKDVANKVEWAKYNFYPSNGLVAEVPYVISRDVTLGIDLDVYILKITENLYVPMTIKGVKFIEEAEYIRLKPDNKLKGMDERQQRINSWDDLFTSFPLDCRNPGNLEFEADIYCRSAKYSISKNAMEISSQIAGLAQEYRDHNIELYSRTEVVDLIVRWVRNAVSQNGWDSNDKDGVSWFAALFVKSYCVAMNNEQLFDPVFKAVFVRTIKK